jgi:hypothetical protein
LFSLSLLSIFYFVVTFSYWDAMTCLSILPMADIKIFKHYG